MNTLCYFQTSSASKILAAKKADPQADTGAWEAEVDVLVYLLYGLTWDEVQIVESSSSQTTLHDDKVTYEQWLERYRKEGVLPSEKEIANNQ